MKISDMIKQELTNLKKEAAILNTKEGVTLQELENMEGKLKVTNAKLQSQLSIEEDEEAAVEDNFVKLREEDEKLENNINEKYENAFFNAIQGKKLTQEDEEVLNQVNSQINMQVMNGLSSSSSADGGYLIPIDQQVAIKELKRQFQSLEDEVNVEVVSTLTGSRNIEKEAEFTPFTEFTEGNDVPDAGTPQFVNIQYTIKDRGGFLPIPNKLLADEKANLAPYLNKWLAKKEVATRNFLIFNALKTFTPVVVTGIDDVKNALNVTLDPAISQMSFIYMNQDSFNKFDKMKDSQGNYILEKNPVNPTQKMIDGKIIKVYSNKILKTRVDGTKNKAPVIIGTMKEAITLFDREARSLLSTNIGGEAFRKNRTDIRAITREDVQLVDKQSLIFGEIEI